ncbi:DUF6328 family protein [Nocardioides sp. DS6]|uniref:DUF6328 family protein n=1 Tax=Nocardioides eburneus TaxID=3231482 RepID=A0ABV3T0A3_9ACTN
MDSADPADDGSRRQGDGRRETPEERLDRLWDDLLQELRVMQTGAQLTAGFLLTLPFQQRFRDLDGAQRGLFLALVVLALLTTVLIMTAIRVHQRLSGRHIKERVVGTARRLMSGVLTTLSLLIVGISVLMFDMVLDRTLAIVAGVAFGVLLALLLLALPRRLMSPPRDRADAE